MFGIFIRCNNERMEQRDRVAEGENRVPSPWRGRVRERERGRGI